MPNAGYFEKRRAMRFNVSIPVNFTNPATNELVCAQTHDICEQGIGLISKHNLPTGDDVNLKLIMMDNGEEIKLRGKVLWSQLSTSDYQYHSGIGLQNCNIRPVPIALRVIQSHL